LLGCKAKPLYEATLVCRILCCARRQGKVDDVLNVFPRNLVETEAINDVMDVFSAGPEALAAGIGSDPERGDWLLYFLPLAVPDTDGSFLTAWPLDLGQGLPAICLPSSDEVFPDFVIAFLDRLGDGAFLGGSVEAVRPV